MITIPTPIIALPKDYGRRLPTILREWLDKEDVLAVSLTMYHHPLRPTIAGPFSVALPGGEKGVSWLDRPSDIAFAEHRLPGLGMALMSLLHDFEQILNPRLLWQQWGDWNVFGEGNFEADLTILPGGYALRIAQPELTYDSALDALRIWLDNPKRKPSPETVGFEPGLFLTLAATIPQISSAHSHAAFYAQIDTLFSQWKRLHPHWFDGPRKLPLTAPNAHQIHCAFFKDIA